MGLIQKTKEKIKNKQEDSANKAIEAMTKQVVNEVKKELNPQLELLQQKINEKVILLQKKYEIQIQKLLEKQTKHFNGQLKEQGPILKKYVKDNIKEWTKNN